jgi:predicted PurR-regulated permease PerM
MKFPKTTLKETAMNQLVPTSPVRLAIEIAVYLLLIFVILAWCVQIVRPFIPFIIWGTIIAVSVYPLFLKLRAKLGERNKMAVFIFAVVGLAVFLVPAWMLGGSLIGSLLHLENALAEGTLHVPAANESVREWPLIGERLYSNWVAASTNLSAWLQANNEQIKAIVQSFVAGVAGAGLTVLQFIAAVLIAAALLANDEATKAAMLKFLRRLVGDRAEEYAELSSATIRSITLGVLGIAFIQAFAGGLGMVFIGIPGAGLWALFILILAIAQLPPLLVLLPAIAYVFSTNDSTTAAVIFTVWSLIVSFSDTFLKPLLLGRGVKAPMLVILLGAIGGMIAAGIVGLFVGAVILALGYTLFQDWLSVDEETAEDPEQHGETA